MMKYLSDLASYTFPPADATVGRERVTSALIVAVVTFFLSILAAYFGLIILALLLSLVFGVSVAFTVAQTKLFWRLVELYSVKDPASKKARIGSVVIIMVALVLLYLYLMSKA